MEHNLILIGMPGAGKSTIGVVLAKKLGYSFLDSDLLIQQQEAMLLHEIIEQKGYRAFNKIENQVNAHIMASHTVIATGGSVIYGAEAMEHLKSIGTIIYLHLPYYKLRARLGDLNKRGVSMRPGQTLETLFNERTPLYEKYADLTIYCNGKPIRKIVHEIADKLEAISF